MNESLLATGQISSNITDKVLEVPVHYDVISPLKDLKTRAWEEAGIDLRLASGFRSFERQLYIWNQKARGERPVYNQFGEQIQHSSVPRDVLMYAILHWSALPGASRHHWGTDFDVFDAAAIEEGYQLQLSPEEYAEGGPFKKLNHWLAGYFSHSRCGFVRPYCPSPGGVAEEPWHISYLPVASVYESTITVDVLSDLISRTDIELKTEILENMQTIFNHFFLNQPRNASHI
ncbi:M15 family metallopeptidase [Teredinibacter sp. KSP-S5-2]|uniref:M15 family metallopeptidase n=1 Tax=Teredinibacter sp. KSP-S5-2 TaxID=3034506 RepID=UPI002934CE62|nr:M15 family metallopeptidase [Teredinibacter sp. KSP-S5-2]WNO09474.1 M15 family metallopeptidase [Teredinibacter sp. KSP-S5-2]